MPVPAPVAAVTALLIGPDVTGALGLDPGLDRLALLAELVDRAPVSPAVRGTAATAAQGG